MLGYIVLIWDALHWCQRDQAHRVMRDRGVFGATFDGGLSVARPSQNIQGPTNALNAIRLGEVGGEQFSPRMIEGMQGEGNRTQDGVFHVLDQLELSDDEGQQ